MAKGEERRYLRPTFPPSSRLQKLDLGANRIRYDFLWVGELRAEHVLRQCGRAWCATAMARRSRCFDVSTGENFAKVPMRQLALGLVAVAPNTCHARRKQCCRKKVGFPLDLPYVCAQLLCDIFGPLREFCSIRVASDSSMTKGDFGA